jgi:hypothetical protein
MCHILRHGYGCDSHLILIAKGAEPLLSCCAVQVAFTEVPKFSFDLSVLGGDASVLPGLVRRASHRRTNEKHQEGCMLALMT